MSSALCFQTSETEFIQKRIRNSAKTNNVLHFQLVQMDSLGLTATRCASARMLLAATMSWEHAAASLAGWERPASSVGIGCTLCPCSQTLTVLTWVPSGNVG